MDGQTDKHDEANSRFTQKRLKKEKNPQQKLNQVT
jgi:hypothetical protein